mmetsp:Transcript_3879/g.11049  ORF Transcript_3879/g.11049 Transcript_3879/m.11049 type:complete len:230 (+) Transcript_3879:67-756(+)
MRALLFFIPALVPVTSMRPEEANNKNWQERCCLCHYSQTWSLRKFTFDIAWAVSTKTKPECGKLCNAADAHGEGAVKVNKDTCVRPAERGSTKCEGSFNAHRLLVAGDDKNGEHLGGELGATPNAQGSGQRDDRSFVIQALQFMAKPAGAAWAEKAKEDTWKSLDGAFEEFIKAYALAIGKTYPADKQATCARYSSCLIEEGLECAFTYDFAAKTLKPSEHIDSSKFIR